MINDWNIQDDEIRIIGDDSDAGRRRPPKRGRPLVWVLVALAALLIIGGIILIRKASPPPEYDVGLFEDAGVLKREYLANSLQGYASTAPPFAKQRNTIAGRPYTEVQETTVNDIPLSLFIPHNAVPELCLMTPDYNDGSIILATQAADIRKDNEKIVGDFVLKGTPLARGDSKKGYCAIIDGRITAGVAKDTPLFDVAIATGGYFFRQYPLVDCGRPVDNALRNKTFRKALCIRGDEVFLVKSGTPETFHDFAQALVDLGVDNAIYLVGSTSYGFWHDRDGHLEEFSDLRNSPYPYESYILWRGKE